jgi:hypothetical protein
MLLKGGLGPDLAARRDGLNLFDIAVERKNDKILRAIVYPGSGFRFDRRN